MYDNNPNPNQTSPNNPSYNYPPNVPYQQFPSNANPDAYYQSNPQNMYNAPTYQQPNPYQNHGQYPANYPPQDPNQIIIVQVPQIQHQILIENQIASRDPQSFYCPYCMTNVVTEVKYEAGEKTSLMACCLCFFGGVICCLIPYCVNDCQDAIHYCPLCRSIMGKVPF